MSNEVDKRIIEMEFKNDQFEKNAAKTLQTLQELKQKLNDNFSTKGPEQLNQAIKAVDVNPIMQGIDTVHVKLSALQIAGKRIVENLTDAAMNAIKKVTNALSAPLNQIKQGGAARAQNIEQAKFMLSGLGIEWKDIVDDINYGVQDTAYGLDAAAKVASQLVASNVSLGKDMQASLRGVSGVAAMTNSTYEEIGHIFTSVAGQGKLMTMQLQQFSLRGLNVAADLAKSMDTTEAAIREMVTKGQIDFQTFANAMDKLYGGHAKKANDTFTGALSNTKAALSRLGADIQSQKFESFRIILLEITTQLKELKKAFKPAEDAIISMMDAVGKLVANFVKSINIKSIVEKITPSIEKFANYIRDFANAWLNIREAQEKIKNITFTNIADYYQQRAEALRDTTDEVKDSVETLATLGEKDLKKYHDYAWDIWNFGKYGNGQDRVDALGEDYELTQEYVNKMIELGWDEAKMEEYLTEQKKKLEEQRKRQEAAQRLKSTVSKILTIFTNLRTVISNLTSSIANILKAAFGGLTDAISGKGTGFLDALIFLTQKLADFTTKIAITKDVTEKIRPVAKKIGDIVVAIAKGLYTCIKYLVNFIESASKNKIVRGIFEAIGTAIGKVVDGLKNLYTKMRESGAWDKFVDILKDVGTWLGEKIIAAITNFGDIVSSIGGGAISIFEKIVGKLKDTSDNAEKGHGWLSKIKDFFKEDVLSGSWLTKLKDLLTDIFGTGKDVFQNAYKRASDFINGLVAGFKSLDSADWKTILSAIGQIGLTFSTIRWLYSMVAVNKTFNTAITNFNKIFEALGTTIKKYGKRADAQRFESFAKSVAIIIGSLVAMMLAFAWIEGKGFDAQRIAIVCGTIVGILSAIVGLIIVLTTWLGRAADYYNTSKSINILGRTRIPALALTLFSIGYLLKTLIESVLTMYNFIGSEEFNAGKMVWVSTNIAVLLGAIMLFVTFGIKAGKSLQGMTGFALTIVAMGILFNTVLKGFKKILKIVNDEDIKRSDIDKTISVINWLTFPLYIFGAAIALISKIPTNAVSNVNPFKGMLGMFVGLAALIRFGFRPLFESILELRKEGEIGATVISDFKSIVNTLYIFIGLITVAVALLDRSMFKDSRVTGAEFLDGKYVGDAMTGGKRSITNNKLIWGVVGVIGSLALLMYTISAVMKNMQGVDYHSVSRFKDIINTLSILISIVTIIAVIGGTVSNAAPEFTAAVLAIAGVIASIAAVLFASAYAFKTFTETLMELIDFLPEGVKRLVEFFELIEDYDTKDSKYGGHSRGGNSVRDKLIKGISDTISLVIEGVVSAIATTSAYSLVVGETIVESIVGAIEGAAQAIVKFAPQIKSSLKNLRNALAYAFVYALIGEEENDNFLTPFKELATAEIKEDITDAIIAVGDILPGGSTAATVLKAQRESNKDEGHRRYAVLKELEEQANAIGEETANTAYGGYRAGYEMEMAKKRQEAAEEDGIEIVDFMHLEFDEDKLIEKAEDKFKDFDSNKIKDYFTSKVNSMFGSDNLGGLLQMGDFGSINSKLNLNLSTEQYEGLLDGIDPMTEEGQQEFQNRLNNLMSSTEGQWDIWADGFKDTGEESMDKLGEGIDERMEFVTDITHAAAQKAVDEVNKFESDFYTAGKFCAQGFADGIRDYDANQRVYHNVADMVIEARRSLEKTADEHSPSKLFMKLGRFITIGFANGITEAVTTATGAANEVGEATILSMRETIKQASLEAVNGIDNPRITPILDLSNVTEGVGIMNGLFDASPAYQLAMATSGEARAATRTRMSAIYQNGSNYDDTNAIGAINSLNSEVSTLKNAIEGMQVVIDGRALVGQIATPMDKALGRKAMAGRRKV